MENCWKFVGNQPVADRSRGKLSNSFSSDRRQINVETCARNNAETEFRGANLLPVYESSRVDSGLTRSSLASSANETGSNGRPCLPSPKHTGWIQSTHLSVHISLRLPNLDKFYLHTSSVFFFLISIFGILFHFEENFKRSKLRITLLR